MATKNIAAAITAAEAASMKAYRDRNPRIRGIFQSPINALRKQIVMGA